MALHPCRLVTASELPVGNGRTGAPVNALWQVWQRGLPELAQSGGLVRNQGGTVEYYMYMYPTPDYVRGRGIFLSFPKRTRRNLK